MDNHVGATKEQVTVRAEEGEAVRGLLKRAKLADISLDVLHIETPISRVFLRVVYSQAGLSIRWSPS